MDFSIRPAVVDDAPFLAWVQQEASRSHLPFGFWDLAIPGREEHRLGIIERIARHESKSFSHWSRFLVASDAVHHRRRGRGEADTSDRRATGLEPAPMEALRQHDSLDEVTRDRGGCQRPLDGEVVRLAEEGQLAARSCVPAGGPQVADGQVHQRRHVQDV